MKLVATIVGLMAVALCILSYQMKTRRNIILFNGSSRVLYVAQYIMLGAFEGALLDLVALLVTVICKNRDKGIIKKHLIFAFILSNVFIVASGLVLYDNIFDILPVLGVIFETLALWLMKERYVRIVSLIAVPFWLAYNLICGAYGSAVGNVITLVSITVAIVRYDILKKSESKVQ